MQKVARERVLTDAEIRQLWAATEPTGGDTVEDRYAKILRLLLLTGQRRGEVGGIRRAELDLGARSSGTCPVSGPRTACRTTCRSHGR